VLDCKWERAWTFAWAGAAAREARDVSSCTGHWLVK
jgi:hypothetical protein